MKDITITGVSVVIPTFNRGHTLGRALDSVAAQQWKNLEVIVVDDGSIDNTPRLITRDYPTVRYLRNNTNRGASFVRNQGIAAATKEWVAFLDSDDYWRPEKLAIQIRAMIDDRHRR